MDKLRFNLHSAAGLAQEQNHNEKLSSIHTFNSVNPLVHLRNELLPVACGLLPASQKQGPLRTSKGRAAQARADAHSNYVRLQERQQRKKMKYTKLNVHWKVARTLIRLMKKGTKLQNILFNLNKYNLFKVFSPKFKLICEILNKKFKKPVELQLIRIHQPFQDSNILVNLLSLNIRNKNFKTNVQIDKLLKKRVVKNVYDYQNKSVNFIPTYLSGINIRIGGRLLREPIIPRISKKNFERGARSIGKVNYLDSASITNKNRKGSYTLKISSGQNFF
jgi:ribosomal VAR1-like protein